MKNKTRAWLFSFNTTISRTQEIKRRESRKLSHANLSVCVEYHAERLTESEMYGVMRSALNVVCLFFLFLDIKNISEAGKVSSLSRYSKSSSGLIKRLFILVVFQVIASQNDDASFATTNQTMTMKSGKSHMNS